MGIVYLVQPEELLNTNRFKVGCSKNNDYSRLSKYHKKCKIISIRECEKNYKKIEKKIICKFKKKYKLIAGNEYFEADKKIIENEFNIIVTEYNIKNTNTDTDDENTDTDDENTDTDDENTDTDDENTDTDYENNTNLCNCIYFNDEDYYDNECVVCRNSGKSYWSKDYYGECIECGGNCYICSKKYRKKEYFLYIEDIQDLSKYLQYNFDYNEFKITCTNLSELYKGYIEYFNNDNENNTDDIIEYKLFKLYIKNFKGIKLKNKNTLIINNFNLIKFLKDNKLYNNNNIIKNYEDLINKTEFNKIIIHKTKLYGYIQHNGLYYTILEEYDESLSKKENLKKNLELWIESHTYNFHIQDMKYLINDIIIKCSINKLVEYKRDNNEFIINNSNNCLHIYNFITRKYKYYPENNYILNYHIYINKIENFDNLNINIVEDILKNYINNDEMFKNFKKLINAIFFRNNKESIIFKTGIHYSLYYDIRNLFSYRCLDYPFIEYTDNLNKKDIKEHIKNLKNKKLYDNVRFISIREDFYGFLKKNNYQEIIDKYIKEGKINVFIIYNDKYKYETDDIKEKVNKIEINIANYLEENKQYIKKNLNREDYREDYKDNDNLQICNLFQDDSGLKLNYLKWCITSNN
jgi:hypothetical protein